jgi:hypothetical protein
MTLQFPARPASASDPRPQASTNGQDAHTTIYHDFVAFAASSDTPAADRSPDDGSTHDTGLQTTRSDLLTIGQSTASGDLSPVPGIDPRKLIHRGQSWIMLDAADRHIIPAVEWIVPGEIPAHALTVIYGPSGVGKSFFIVDVALRVAQEHPVVYLAREGENGVPSRIDAWCAYHNQPSGRLALALGTVAFFDERDIETFIAGCTKVNPVMVMVIVDTLARSMVGADENSTRDMNRFTAQCTRIIRALNCAVVLVHHTGRYGDHERGSTVLRGAADSMIALVDDDDLIQVECAKTKDAKPFPSRVMTLHPVDVGVVDAHGTPITTPVIHPE